jgi:DNA repair exonuclease SbcCD ATPase subunit
MKLLSLTLRNFKGMPDFALQADGQNIAIYGENSTGKTTVADAFYFLLFGKDSLNRKDFEVLPLDTNGMRVPEITQAEVEGVFDIDGQGVVLKRVFSEKWTKKRGSAQKEFTGHVTDYYIDEVPVKQKDYEAKIAQLTDTEEAFKLLTNPRYFCEVLPWVKRRELLMQVCGDLTDDEVIATDQALAALPAILGDHSLDDHRKIVKAKHADINKELEKIPVRIDEVQRGLPAEQPADAAEAHESLSILQNKRKAKLEEKTRIETGGEIAQLTKMQREIEAGLLKMANEENKATNTEIQKHRQAIADLQMHLTTLKNQVKGNLDLMKRNTRLADNLDGILVDLRKEWAELSAKEYTSTDTCPTCGQTLPAEQVEAAKAQWNGNKAKKLEAIQSDGIIQRKKLDELKAENERLTTEIAGIEESITATEQTIKDEHENLAATPAEGLNPEYVKKQGELADVKGSIANLKRDNAGALNIVESDITEIDSHIADVEAILAQVKQRAEGLKRIDELKAQQKKLAKEYEELERQLYLTDLFVQAKVGLLEDKINSRFAIAKWKLFEIQINGGLAECCECTVGGIPYGGGLNNSAKINAGLDIINTLSEHFGFAPVVFIDNSEAVTKLLPTKGQQVRLYVSEVDKQLRIEQAKEAVHA